MAQKQKILQSDLNQSLIYEKCYFCGKTELQNQLIDIETSEIIIENDRIDFSDLIFSLFLFLITKDGVNKYLCMTCKDQLVSFHIFTRDVKKYSCFKSHLNRQKIFYEIDNILEDTFNYSIHQDQDQIIISKNKHLYESTSDELIERDDEEIIIEDRIEDEEQTSQLLLEEEYIDEELQETPQHSFAENDWNESGTESEKRHRKKYVYKTNTNESLSIEQREWIIQEVKKSEIVANGKKLFKCSICGTILQISGSLKKHLRDSHILKSNNEREESIARKAFKDEINRSKIQIETNDGVETIYKCHRCNIDRVFRSESGLKVHIRYNHIRDHIIDAEFVAKCKITIKTEKGFKLAWQCCDCQKILKSRDGLRNHMKLEHGESIAHLEKTDRQTKNFDKSLSSSLDKNSLLQLAKRRKTSNANNSTCCEQCGVAFTNGTTKKEKSCEIHQQLHIILKVISESYDLPRCEECKVMFSNDEDLNMHTMTHDVSQVFDAKGLTFLVARKFNEPKGTTDDINDWKCGHCPNVRFAQKTDCVEHQLILHSKQLICPFDYLEFNGIRGLGIFSSHMKNKHPEMFPELSIFCSYCGQEFCNVFDKLTHMKICDRKLFACDHCDKTYFTKTQLSRHLKIVSGKISFVCEICSKNCTSSMDLKLHLRVHTNEKTYQCKFLNCMKIFKTPAARSSHMEIHSNTTYECTDCKTIFKQRALLQRHLKKVKCKGSHSNKMLKN